MGAANHYQLSSTRFGTQSKGKITNEGGWEQRKPTSEQTYIN